MFIFFLKTAQRALFVTFLETAIKLRFYEPIMLLYEMSTTANLKAVLTVDKIFHDVKQNDRPLYYKYPPYYSAFLRRLSLDFACYTGRGTRDN